MNSEQLVFNYVFEMSLWTPVAVAEKIVITDRFDDFDHDTALTPWTAPASGTKPRFLTLVVSTSTGCYDECQGLSTTFLNLTALPFIFFLIPPVIVRQFSNTSRFCFY
jgi:hypothetical protein